MHGAICAPELSSAAWPTLEGKQSSLNARAPLAVQIPHYNLEAATEACKPVLGPYYREPVKSPGPLPTHLVEPLIRSFQNDHYVADTGDIVYYQKVSGYEQ